MGEVDSLQCVFLITLTEYLAQCYLLKKTQIKTSTNLWTKVIYSSFKKNIKSSLKSSNFKIYKTKQKNVESK